MGGIGANDDELMIPLSNENILLRGMSLRNTEMVIGVVVTRAMKRRFK